MKHLYNLSKLQLAPVPTSFVIAILVVAVLGFADAAYLTIEHFRGVIPPCSVVSGCETVLTSSYSNILGMPVSLLGAIYYFLIAVGMFAYVDTKKTVILKWTLSITIFGLLMSLWFIFLQAFVIKAWCLYCLGSAASSIVLFVLAGIVFKKYMIYKEEILNPKF
ncbi:MAG: vitamin K epoxide reductase family protein [Candidatus Pacebacteria bacterium]|nr:vitamin K epoxide reductase family protein [Candidatus Paceibacterota bacterium]